MAVKRSMWPCQVVERQVVVQSLSGCADGFVGVQIDLLVFGALPESLHDHIVAQETCAVHADLEYRALSRSS